MLVLEQDPKAWIAMHGGLSNCPNAMGHCHPPHPHPDPPPPPHPDEPSPVDAPVDGIHFLVLVDLVDGLLLQAGDVVVVVAAAVVVVPDDIFAIRVDFPSRLASGRN